MVTSLQTGALVGSVVTFIFLAALFVFLWADVSMTHILLGKLDAQFHPKYWPRTYSEVLPYLHRACFDVLQDIRNGAPIAIGHDVARVIRQLCDPEPIPQRSPKEHRLPWEQLFT